MSKSFKSAAADLANTPVPFDLDNEVFFEVPRPLPGFPVADLASKAELGGVQAIAAFLDFFEAVMEPQEFERFRKEATKRRIDLETLVQISSYIIEEGSGRPKEQSGTSADS